MAEENQQDQSEKTEEPTQKRLDDARKKGDLPKSQEVSGLAVLLGGTAIIVALAPAMALGLTERLKSLIQQPHAYEVSASFARDLMPSLGVLLLPVLALPVIVLVVFAIAGHLIQTGWVVSGEKMKPKLSKIDPISGAKRVFGKAAISNFLKGVGKIVAVAAACGIAIWPRRDQFVQVQHVGPAELMAIVRDDVIALLFAALVVYALIAIADVIATRVSWLKRQKMSLKEIKDESKNAEGDPMIKAKLRAIRQEKARQRMMSAVPQATVVITNPTHYAVALRYEQGETQAPICVAKGVDEVALRIRALAKDHDVPVVENPPLARALYAAIDIDEFVPEEHFQAVAKVIGYVLGLAARKKSRKTS